jgi:hypothetical protein
MAKTIEKVNADSINTAIVVRTETGVVARITRKLKLSIDDGTLVKMPMSEKTPDGKYLPIVIPSAKGYIQMAGDSGMRLYHPNTVVVGDKEQPNGYEDNGRIYCRSACLGFTSSGSEFFTDRTIVYDVHLYNLQDLIAKASKDEYKKWFMMLPLFRDSNGNLVGGPENAEDKTKWIGYPVDDYAVLWVNPKCPEFISWYREMINRRKTAVRVAQTFADRNAIAAHPGLPMARKFHTPEAVVEVTTWYAQSGSIKFNENMITFDPSKLLKASVEHDASTVPTDITAEVTTIEAERRANPTEPEDATTPEEEDDLNMTPTPEAAGTPPAAGAQGDEALAEVLASIKRVKGKIMLGVYLAALEKVGIKVKNDKELATVPFDKLLELVKTLTATT